MIIQDFASLYRNQVKALFAARSELKRLAELSTAILATVPDGPLPGHPDVTKADLATAIQAAGELETHLTDFTVNPNVPTPTNQSLQKLL